MGVFGSHEDAGIERRYAAFLTSEEERRLETTFSDGKNVAGRLNDPPSFVLIHEERDLASLSSFLQFVIKLLRTSPRDTTELVWNSIKCEGDAEVDSTEVDLIMVEYLSLLIKFSGVETAEAVLKVVAEKMAGFVKAMNHTGTSSSSIVLRFCDSYFSFHEGLLKTHFMKRLGIPPSQSFMAFDAPFLAGQSDIVVNDAEVLFIGLHSRLCQGEWMRLYSTAEDGYDFENLRNNIVGYQGGTVILIRTTRKEVFGSFCGATWRETGDTFFGSNKAFLFTIEPHIRIYRNLPNAGETQQYLNTRGYARDAHGLGLGMGSGKEAPYSTGLDHRLFIPKSMSECYAAPSCHSYEPGPLLGDTEESSFSFEIDVMEVWGTGGEAIISEALAGLEDKRAQKRRVQERARKVDRAAFFDNEFDQEMFLGNTFQHRMQMEQR